MHSLIVGAALFVCCAYAGFGISAYYRKRYLFFAAMTEYVDALASGISYAKTPLPKLTRAFADGKRGDASQLLAKFADNAASGEGAKCEQKFLSAFERKTIEEFLDSLGRYDSETQLAELARHRSIIVPIAKDCEEKYRKTGKLAAKLGILVGIAVMLALA